MEVGNFYIATNGACITEDFVVACLRWYAYCDDNEISSVSVSNDAYHQNEEGYNTDLLDGLSFFSRRHTEEGTEYKLIRQGRAENERDGRNNETEQLELEHYHESKVIEVQEPVIYLNALGNVILGCDWSYESQEQLVYCDASEFTKTIVAEAIFDN